MEKYPGKHDNNCIYNTPITGTIVKDKIYTFGGCYPIPYTIEINNNDDIFTARLKKENSINITNEIYVYDINQDKWYLEGYTPKPFIKAYTQVVNENIYFFNIEWNNNRFDINNKNNIWIYNTISKEWFQMEDLKFNWNGRLLTCEKNGKIYFMGSNDGQQRNILQIYNTILKEWENSILLEKSFYAEYMICKKEIIYFLGRENNNGKRNIDNFNNDGLIIMHENKTLEYAPLSMRFGWDASISISDNYVYTFGNGNTGGEKQIVVTRINLEKHTKKKIGILNPIKTSLNIFYNNSIILFGGKYQGQINKCYEYDEDCVNSDKNNDIMKVFNHKIILSKENNNYDDINKNIKFKVQN